MSDTKTMYSLEPQPLKKISESPSQSVFMLFQAWTLTDNKVKTVGEYFWNYWKRISFKHTTLQKV